MCFMIHDTSHYNTYYLQRDVLEGVVLRNSSSLYCSNECNIEVQVKHGCNSFLNYLACFRVPPHRHCLQLSVNGSLNEHMAKQVLLFQTPVKTWLPMPANQRHTHGDIAIAGTTCIPEGPPTTDQLSSYMPV